MLILFFAFLAISAASLLFLVLLHPLIGIVQCLFSKFIDRTGKLLWVVSCLFTGPVGSVAYGLCGTHSLGMRRVTVQPILFLLIGVTGLMGISIGSPETMTRLRTDFSPEAMLSGMQAADFNVADFEMEESEFAWEPASGLVQDASYDSDSARPEEPDPILEKLEKEIEAFQKDLREHEAMFGDPELESDDLHPSPESNASDEEPMVLPSQRPMPSRENKSVKPYTFGDKVRRNPFMD